MTLNDSGEIPTVVGVILMVAITVILAAIIASFMFGLVGSANEQELTTKTITVRSICDVSYASMIITTTEGEKYKVVGLTFVGWEEYLQLGETYNVTINSDCEITSYENINQKKECSIPSCTKRCSC